MNTARQVAKWLKPIRRTQSVRPCEVTIGSDTYEGAMYECVGEYIANQDAIVRGDRNVGDIYIQRSIYLVGNVPKVVRQRRRTCFPFEGQDWYLAAHSDRGTKLARIAHSGHLSSSPPGHAPARSTTATGHTSECR